MSNQRDEVPGDAWAVVKAVRLGRGWTPEYLAGLIGVHPGNLRKWEAGRSTPNPEAWRKFLALVTPEDPLKSREKARSYLLQLNKQDDPRFETDPVALLGELAVTANAPRPGFDIATASRAASENYIELGRGVTPIDGVLNFSNSDQFDTVVLSVPFTGAANLLLVGGSWPADPRSFMFGTTRMSVAPMNGPGCGWGRLLVWGWDEDLVVSIDSVAGTHEIQVRVYDGPGDFDICVLLLPVKQLDQAAVFVS